MSVYCETLWNFILFACFWIRIDLAWIRRIRIKVRPVTGSVTHFVQILDPDPYKMIRIRNTDAPDYKICVFI